jgi:hypothetical protein
MQFKCKYIFLNHKTSTQTIKCLNNKKPNNFTYKLLLLAYLPYAINVKYSF